MASSNGPVVCCGLFGGMGFGLKYLDASEQPSPICFAVQPKVRNGVPIGSECGV